MTRKASVWLFGSALAVLVLGPILASPPMPRAAATMRQTLAAPSAAIGAATNVADDDDELRQQRGARPIPVSAVLSSEVPAPEPPSLVLARHELSFDSVPIGVRKLPAPTTDAPASH
jgi:hypothetical protein